MEKLCTLLSGSRVNREFAVLQLLARKLKITNRSIRYLPLAWYLIGGDHSASVSLLQ